MWSKIIDTTKLLIKVLIKKITSYINQVKLSCLICVYMRWYFIDSYKHPEKDDAGNLFNTYFINI